MKKINVEFTIDDEMYNDYEDILTDFENNLSSIGVEEINTYEDKDYGEDIKFDIETPFANCVIIFMSNGWRILKSYNKTIAKKKGDKTYIDLRYYNYSASTGKHRNYFLRETLKDTDKKIKSGEYKTADLN